MQSYLSKDDLLRCIRDFLKTQSIDPGRPEAALNNRAFTVCRWTELPLFIFPDPSSASQSETTTQFIRQAAYTLVELLESALSLDKSSKPYLFFSKETLPPEKYEYWPFAHPFLLECLNTQCEVQELSQAGLLKRLNRHWPEAKKSHFSQDLLLHKGAWIEHFFPQTLENNIRVELNKALIQVEPKPKKISNRLSCVSPKRPHQAFNIDLKASEKSPAYYEQIEKLCTHLCKTWGLETVSYEEVENESEEKHREAVVINLSLFQSFQTRPFLELSITVDYRLLIYATRKSWKKQEIENYKQSRESFFQLLADVLKNEEYPIDETREGKYYEEMLASNLCINLAKSKYRIIFFEFLATRLQYLRSFNHLLQRSCKVGSENLNAWARAQGISLSNQVELKTVNSSDFYEAFRLFLESLKSSIIHKPGRITTFLVSHYYNICDIRYKNQALERLREFNLPKQYQNLDLESKAYISGSFSFQQAALLCLCFQANELKTLRSAFSKEAWSLFLDEHTYKRKSTLESETFSEWQELLKEVKGAVSSAEKKLQSANENHLRSSL